MYKKKEQSNTETKVLKKKKDHGKKREDLRTLLRKKRKDKASERQNENQANGTEEKRETALSK